MIMFKGCNKQRESIFTMWYKDNRHMKGLIKLAMKLESLRQACNSFAFDQLFSGG